MNEDLKITKTDEELLHTLELMLSDMHMQDDIYKPTNFWLHASEPIVQDLKKYGFSNFRNLSSTRNFFVPTYGSPGNALSDEDMTRLNLLVNELAEEGTKNYRFLAHMLSGESWALSDYRVYRAANNDDVHPRTTFFSESQAGNPSELFCFEKQQFSRSSLNYLNGLSFLKQHVDTTSIKTVLEVGGGFGTLGEILHAAGGISYVNVDIPPTSIVSTFYLKQIPALKMSDYRVTREMEEINIPLEPVQMVLCPWQLPALRGTVDLFVNFISFQEMEPTVVKNYLEHVNRLKTKYVLLRNMREGKAPKSSGAKYGVETPIKGDDYDQFLANYRLLATNVFPFGYKTMDGFHSELRLYERK
ncbi:putative sugar O-methyltransferase [Oxalicibacterium solurbis]|uniref:Sugar O-methyltransferase n=1 Tax=Oxalicibacterium solurbis TaxID=69280 RepID=A0A8J3AWV4_9BURK|nr:putative sugar O-methyltransferase [Oxalicibacterium solurbis]GGI54427.1 hypothetical protein GCM10011430_16010 [Oxalicibacterium solurbis]